MARGAQGRQPPCWIQRPTSSRREGTWPGELNALEAINSRHPRFPPESPRNARRSVSPV